MTEERKNEFIKFIENKDILQIRSHLESINSLDPNGEKGEITDRLLLLKGKISDDELYEKHEDGDAPILKKESWNEDYFNEQKVELQYNFSKERFEHVRKLGKFIFPHTPRVTSPKDTEIEQNSQKKTQVNQKIVIAGIVVVGLLAIIALTK